LRRIQAARDDDCASAIDRIVGDGVQLAPDLATAKVGCMDVEVQVSVQSFLNQVT